MAYGRMTSSVFAGIFAKLPQQIEKLTTDINAIQSRDEYENCVRVTNTLVAFLLDHQVKKSFEKAGEFLNTCRRLQTQLEESPYKVKSAPRF